MKVTETPSNFLNAKFLMDNKARELTILDEGLEVDTKDFKGKDVKRIRVNVKCNDPTKTHKLWELNQASKKTMVRLFGDDTKFWVGKIVKVNFVPFENHFSIQIDEMDTEVINKQAKL